MIFVDICSPGAPWGPMGASWGPHGPPIFDKIVSRKTFSVIWAPLGGPRGRPNIFFRAPWGARGGARKPRGVQNGTLGDPWRPQKRLKSVGFMCILATGGSQEGTREKLQKLPDGLAMSSETQGSKMEWLGAPGPPWAPLGPPKRAAHH